MWNQTEGENILSWNIETTCLFFLFKFGDKQLVYFNSCFLIILALTNHFLTLLT